MASQAKYTAAANALVVYITKLADDYVPSMFREAATPERIRMVAGAAAKVAVDAAEGVD